jgi:hypothetical protein
MGGGKTNVLSIIDTNVLLKCQENAESNDSKYLLFGKEACWQFYYSQPIWEEWERVLSARRITPYSIDVIIKIDEANKLNPVRRLRSIPEKIEKEFKRFMRRRKRSNLKNDRMYLELCCEIRSQNPASEIKFLTRDPNWRGFNSREKSLKLDVEYINPDNFTSED